MPRRFALALLALLILLLLGLLIGRRVHEARQKRQVAARPTPTRTIPPPPTPIPARLVSIWFESAEDGLFHPEAREVPAAVDDVAFLRSLAGAVLEGPRHPALLKPFPDGWTLRAAFRLADGLAVLDLAPPAPPTPTPTPEPSPVEVPGKKGAKKPEPTPTIPPPVAIAELPKRWETGSSEEVGATQSLVLTVTKNLHYVSRVILLVGGEPVETLAGHVEIEHLEELHEIEVLLRDVPDRDVVDVHLIALDEIEEQIQRPLEDFEFHFVFLRHEGAEASGRVRDGKENVAK